VTRASFLAAVVLAVIVAAWLNPWRGASFADSVIDCLHTETTCEGGTTR
jgi:hypothetical protein